jgi:predicted nucleotide-binding protein
MLEKIAEFKALKAEISEIDNPEDLDYGSLDKLLRSIRLSIKHSFGQRSEYIADLKEIAKSFPKDPGGFPFDDERLEYQYVASTQNLENLIDIMIADLETSQKGEVNPIQSKIKKSSVFIVHGQDLQSVEELRNILTEAGIEPIILYEQPSKGLTIIEKLEEYSDVGFAFILLTPDDLGVKRHAILECYKAYHEQQDATNDEIKNWLKTLMRPIAEFILEKVYPSIENRARQNVILEFGYFIGRLGRNKVCCLYKGNIELPSDMQGICYLHYDKSIDEVKKIILKELKEAEILGS